MPSTPLFKLKLSVYGLFCRLTVGATELAAKLDRKDEHFLFTCHIQLISEETNQTVPHL